MMLLLLGLIVGVGSTWADTVTFDATTDITSAAQSYQTTELTINAKDGSTWKANGYGATANSNIIIGKGGANYLETPKVNGTITSVAVTWSGNTSYYLALQTTSGTELEAKSNPSSLTTETFTISSGSYDQLRLVGRRSSGTSNAAATITKVVVTYTAGGSVNPTYTVTYDANGGTGTMTDSNSPYEEDDEVTLLTNAFTAPEGMVWDSWEVKDASDNNITVSNNTFSMPASNVTVTAQWVADPNAPQYEWAETAINDLTSSDIFVIVGTNSGTYAMTNANGTNSAPTATSVTIANSKITSTVSDNMKWNISGNATDGYTFYPNGSTTTWLYCNTTAASSSNNNMRVGTGDRKVFELNSSSYLLTKDTYTARYVSVYLSNNVAQDWRGYTSSSTTIKFYKRQVVSNDPSISAENVNLAYDATSGEIAYTISNPDGSTLTAAKAAADTWISNVTVDGNNNKVTFTTTANSETTARTGTITLTYGSITKDVTVTQAAAPVSYTTIPALFAAATDSETEVKVTFDSWVVSGVSTNGKNVFVTDNAGNGFVIYSSSDQSGTYAVGSILSGTAVTCNLVKYNGFAELTDLDASDLTITSGGTVTAANVAMADLTGVNTGALVSYENLTCSIDNNKYYLTDGTTTLQVYNALYAFDALEAGKTYNITGVYQQYGNNTKEILPRSAADIEEVTSTVAVTGVTLDQSTLTMEVGDEVTLTATVAPANATNKTVTWSSDDTDVATVDNGVVTAVAAGTCAITVTTSDGSFTATCDVTVNSGSSSSSDASVTYDFSSTDNFLTSYPGSTHPGTGSSNAVETFYYTNGDEFTGSGTNHYFNASGYFMLGKTNATLTLPAFPFNVSKISVTGTSTASEQVKQNIYVGDDAVSTETGGAKNVTNEYEIASNKQDAGTIYTLKVTSDHNTQISKIEVFGYEKVTITDAKYATYSSAYALDFSGTGITVYKAKANSNGTTVNFTKISDGIVPANTGVILYKDVNESTTIDVPVTTTSNTISDNEMVATVTRTQVDWTGGAGYNYIMQKTNENKIVFNKATGAYMPAKRAYLSTNVDASNAPGARLSVVFDDDTTTGIDNVNVNLNDNKVYDLQGRRVAQPQKGLYIVNGKKVVIK